MLRYRNITKYRSVWMALAALWILYYHSSLPPKYYSSFLGYVRFFGFSGVDIFVFASGLGCYHSLTRHYDPIAFLKKRIIRILPSYYVVLTAWLIYQHLRSGISVSSVFANYLCVDFLAGADFQTLWYMNGVWIYYLFALFLVPLCQNASLRRKILLLFLCAAFSVPFFSDIRLMLFSRLPLLFLGICFADYGARHEEIPARLAAALIALSCLGWGLLVYIVKCVPDDRIWAYSLYWFPFILIAPGLCIVLSLLAACLDKVSPQIIRGCTFLGGCTLEIYAVHAFAFQVFRDALSDDILYGTDKRWLLLSVLSVLFAVLLARVMVRLTAKTQKQPAQQT